MVQISALDYCFLVFPQFRKDFDILKKIKALKHMDDEHCKWLLSEICLLEYFYSIGSIAEDAYDSSTSEWWPVETLFGLTLRSLEEIGKRITPDKVSEEYVALRAQLNECRYSGIEIPKRATDLSDYRILITNTPNKLGKKPTLTDYIGIYDFCLRLFESTWHHIFYSFKNDFLDDYFSELPFNVFIKKRDELTDLFIECVEKEFPDIDIKADIAKIYDICSEMGGKTNQPLYIQKLINDGHLMPDGKTIVKSLDDTAEALDGEVDVNAQILSQFRQSDGSEFTKSTRREVANRIKKSAQ